MSRTNGQSYGAMNNIVCALCGTGQDAGIIIPAKVLFPDAANVWKCSRCGLVYLESLDSEEEVKKEEESYWANTDQKKIYLEESIQKIFVDEFEARLTQIEGFTGAKGSLLDVGCGVGHFLGTAKKRGWKVRGMDISGGAHAAAREAYDVEVEVATLENSNLSQELFDVITLWDVIEHIRHPLENLIAANHLLRTGGILAMKTPNEDGFFKQFALVCYRMFGPRAAFMLKYVYYIPHYFSYSKKTMDILLSRSGFETIQYDWDSTPQEFAAEKIETHYAADPKHSKIVALLPVAEFLSRILRRPNKLIVYAKKVRNV